MKEISLIIAPHPDDEIIGCFEILEKYSRTKKLLYVMYAENFRQSIKSELIFGFKRLSFVNMRDALEQMHKIGNLEVVYAPDPYFELHPLHREIGNEALYYRRRGFISRLIFYTTNMNAPYIRTLPEAAVSNKRNSLNVAYPDKSDLWKYEHKYFLFEGRTEWLLDD